MKAPNYKFYEKPKDTISDTISRQAAIKVIDAVFPVDPMKSEYAQGIACGAALAKTYVEQMPSVQPERKVGEWVKISPANIYECSKCGKNVMTDDISEYDFCNGCGADMRGGIK